MAPLPADSSAVVSLPLGNVVVSSLVTLPYGKGGVSVLVSLPLGNVGVSEYSDSSSSSYCQTASNWASVKSLASFYYSLFFLLILLKLFKADFLGLSLYTGDGLATLLYFSLPWSP